MHKVRNNDLCFEQSRSYETLFSSEHHHSSSKLQMTWDFQRWLMSPKPAQLTTHKIYVPKRKLLHSKEKCFWKSFIIQSNSSSISNEVAKDSLNQEDFFLGHQMIDSEAFTLQNVSANISSVFEVTSKSSRVLYL